MKTTINGVEYETFEGDKNSKELGIDTSRKFIVCDGWSFDKGDIIELSVEDNSKNPYFERVSDNENMAISWCFVAYYDESTHKLKVGDRVKALIGNPEGKYGEVVFISNGDDNSPYAVKFEDWDEGHHCKANNNPIDCGDSGFWMDDDELELVEGHKKYYSLPKDFGKCNYDIKVDTSTAPGKSIIMTSTPYGRSMYDILKGQQEEDNKRMERIILKTKQNIMTRVINGLHTSKEDKALAYFNLTNEDGTLNGAGQSEFTDFIYNSGSTDKKEFLAKIVEAHKEAIKN